MGHNTPEVEMAWKRNTDDHEVGKVSTMVRSLRELEWREEKREERGFAQRGRRVAAMSPKEENRRGSSMGTRARIKS